MTTYKVSCVKCKREYQSPEPDDYFCEECFKTHKQVIEDTEKKLANKPKKQVMSDLQKFDAIAKQRGSGNFVKAQDLGIQL
jgi:protein-arginine kinase activator protein McsA